MVALKLDTNYDAKVVKVTCGHSFFRSVAHVEVILENADLQQMHLIQKLFGIS